MNRQQFWWVGYDVLTDPAPVMVMARAVLMAAALLCLLAVPALAQPPNRGDVVQRVADADPARFACAHSGRSCTHDFIVALVCELRAQDRDDRWGLLGQRGNPDDWAEDAVLWCGSGPGHDPTGKCIAGRVSAFDVIVGAGAPGARASWGFIDGAGPAAWVRPPSCPASGGGGGGGGEKPPPAPAPTVNLQPVLDAIAQLRGEVEQLHRTALGTGLAVTEVTARVTDAISRIDQMRERVEGLSATSLVIQNMLENPPAYRGGVFGVPVTLRPQR